MYPTARHITVTALVAASVALGACHDGSVLGPEDTPPPGPAFANVPPMDVSGTWHWSEHGRLVLSEEATPMFGVSPEGPRTILLCESRGELTLVQTGDSFSGSTTQESECETAGGQVTDPAAFPPAAAIVDGRIRGRHLDFTFAAGPVPCLYKVSARVEGGVAVALDGTGQCIVPGHPRSPLPVPPPPIGGGKASIDWNATR